MITIQADALEQADNLIREKKTFIVCGASNTTRVAQEIEKKIELHNLRCRVYTANRRAAMLGILIPTGFTQVLGLGTAIATGVHNLATWDPDYEVVKDLINDKVEVNYKK